MYHTKQDPQSLNVNVRQQLDSLFIGVVLNETSLVEYARTKQLVGYTGGYSHSALSNMQRNMDEVKRRFPALFSEFREIFLSRIRKNTYLAENPFALCDSYVKQFANIRLFTYNEVESTLFRY